MSLLELIPAPYRLAGAGISALAAAGALWAWGNHRESIGDAAGYARGHAEWVQLDAEMTRRALRGTEAAMAETERRLAAQKEIEDAHALELQKARADVAIADAAAGRLRQRVEALIAAARRGQAGPDPAPVAGGPAAEEAGSMLADVFGRCVATVRQLAAYADQARAAGQSCEKSYDSLSEP